MFSQSVFALFITIIGESTQQMCGMFCKCEDSLFNYTFPITFCLRDTKLGRREKRMMSKNTLQWEFRSFRFIALFTSSKNTLKAHTFSIMLCRWTIEMHFPTTEVQQFKATCTIIGTFIYCQVLGSVSNKIFLLKIYWSVFHFIFQIGLHNFIFIRYTSHWR